MPSVTLTHPDGSTDTIAETQGYQWQRALGEMFKLTIDVARSDAQAVTLNRKEDEVELSGVTTGRLVDYNTGGATWRLIVYSFEWDGKTYQPTGGGVKTTDTDDALVKQFVGNVSEWSEGTINSVSGSVELTSSHAQPHERLRKLEQQTQGELRFNADKSVDYVDKLGSDKTGSIILKPGNTNVDGDIRVENRGRTLDATHAKVVGAFEGEAQFFANLVPTSDGRSYDNRINYSTPRWSDSGDDDWARWSNKEAASQSAVDATANMLGDELTETHVTVSATVVDEDLVLGDRIHVTKSNAGIDRDMRVIKIVTKTLDDVPAGTVDEVTLSTRHKARDTDTERARDISRFNVAFEGSTVWGTLSGGRQPVNSSENYVLPIFYPDVVFEHNTELYVRGLEYRAYSGGAADNPDYSNTVVQTSSVSAGDITKGSGNWVQLDSLQVPDNVSELYTYTQIGCDEHGDGQLDYKIRYNDTTDGTKIPDSGGYFQQLLDANETASVSFVDSRNVYNHTVAVELLVTDFSRDSDGDGDIQVGSATQYLGSGRHNHSPNPGINQFGSETPSSVDVKVNGSTEATNIGSGTFETTVDISDTLTKGAWNTIELTSDALGHLDVTLAAEAYRQIGSNP